MRLMSFLFLRSFLGRLVVGAVAASRCSMGVDLIVWCRRVLALPDPKEYGYYGLVCRNSVDLICCWFLFCFWNWTWGWGDGSRVYSGSVYVFAICNWVFEKRL